jgi:ABC-type lipoprotein release transport system permease subunit
MDSMKLIRLDPSVYFVESVPFRADAPDLAFIGAGMLLVSFLATVVPARAAAALDPVVALRNA